jgi:hypothetical protein
MSVFDKVNAEYGEVVTPSSHTLTLLQQANQDTIVAQGNSYIEKNFPRMSYVLRSGVVGH